MPMTAKMSILHRACGYALAVGTILFVWMLIAAATGPEAYGIFQSFTGSLIGKLMLFGWSVALFYHMSTGIRHMFWDMGYLFKIDTANKSGYVVLAAAAAMTGLFWWIVCGG